MRLNVYVSASLAVAVGVNVDGWRVADIAPDKWSDRQRKVAAGMVYDGWRHASLPCGALFISPYNADRGSPGYPVADATEAAVLRVIDAEIAQDDKKAADALSESLKREAMISRNLELLAKRVPVATVKTYDEIKYAFLSTGGGWVSSWDCPEWTAWELELKSSNNDAEAVARGEAKRICDEAKAEAEAEAEAKLRPLSEWVMANGSDLLKARLADGYDWKALARAEWVECQENSFGLTRLDTEGKEYDPRTSPELEEIEFMRRVQKDIPQAMRETTRFLWWTTEEDSEPGAGECGVNIVWITPDGNDVDRDYAIG